MITDLIIAIILMAFTILGLSRPHIALCGVVWVDTLKPQNTSFSFLAGQPLSMVATLVFFIAIVVNFKKVRMPKSFMYHFLMLGFMAWITIATVHAQFQSVAWIKYDFVIKTLFLTYFVPFVITKRHHLEVFLWVVAMSFGMFIFMAGVKTLLGGGGYGIALVGSNGFMYSEGSTLASLAVCLIPIYMHLRAESKLAENSILIKLLLLGYAFCSILTLIGTQARTGMVAIVAYVMLLVVQTKNKFKTLFVLALLPFFILPFVTDAWVERMSTVEDATTTETSAIGRLVVWRWTLDYVAERPLLGGGFYAYLANAGKLDLYQQGKEVEIIQKGAKAFHNIFFEVLGETGYVGLLFFCLIIFLTLKKNYFLNKKRHLYVNEKDKWIPTMALAINTSLALYCVGGLFIGVAFYPWIYYLFGLSTSLSLVKDA
jgi:probable O-glycosylation ligase (exosortase A-associated)